MPQTRYFAPSFAPHAASQGRRKSFTARRWEVWFAQEAAGWEPCFATQYRHFCRDTGCPWRTECKELRAEYLR